MAKNQTPIESQNKAAAEKVAQINKDYEGMNFLEKIRSGIKKNKEIADRRKQAEAEKIADKRIEEGRVKDVNGNPLTKEEITGPSPETIQAVKAVEAGNSAKIDNIKHHIANPSTKNIPSPQEAKEVAIEEYKQKNPVAEEKAEVTVAEEPKTDVTASEAPEAASTETAEVTDTSLSDEEKEKAKAQIEETGFDPETSDEKDAINAIYKIGLENDLMDMDKDGNVYLKPYSPTLDGKIAAGASAVSILLSILSGGAFPALDYNKIIASNPNEKAKRDAYEKLSNALSDAQAKLATTKTTADIDKDMAKEAGLTEYYTGGAFAKDQQAFDNQIKLASNALANQKDMAQFMAVTNANEIPYKIAALSNMGIDPSEIARWIQSAGGQTAEQYKAQLQLLQNSANWAPILSAAGVAMPFVNQIFGLLK